MKKSVEICILCKNEIHAKCVESVNTLRNGVLSNYFTIEVVLATGQSDLPKARSEQLTRWYESKSEGVFIFIDADQTFNEMDIGRMVLLSDKYDVVCGGYCRKNGTLALEPLSVHKFYTSLEGELYYGATGAMCITRECAKKVIERMNLKKTQISLISTAYPFFLERVVVERRVNRELWLSEDYSFCWLVREAGGSIYGFISKTIGHVIPEEKFFVLPKVLAWSRGNIAIYCGPTAERWSYTSLQKGCGGSELAVIKLAEEWNKLGYGVKIFTSCDVEGYMGDRGVEFLDTNYFSWTDIYDVLVIWRRTEVFEKLEEKGININARVCIVDMHDIPRERDFTFLSKRKDVNYVCVKSEYHSNLIKKCVKGTVHWNIAIIPNGGGFELKECSKNRSKLIYTSSYDRGLMNMLKWGFPYIREKCPSVELHLYYGWNTYDAYDTNPDRVAFKIKMVELMKQPGVIDHGRVTNEKLNQERLDAFIHYYIGDFGEIDCISVRESACTGVIPVVSEEMEVFKEKPYCVLIKGDTNERETHENAGRVICDLIEKGGRVENPPVLETWENTARMWRELFESRMN